MRVFVTGGTGFIGTALVRKLKARGDDVVCLVRPTSRTEGLRALGAELAVGDVIEPETLRAPMEKADAVVHAAAWYAYGPLDQNLMRRINVEGSVNVFRAARELNIPRVIHVSSVAALGNTNGRRVNETHRHGPDFRTFYERTKARAHEEALAWIAKGAPIVIVLPGPVYGPADPSGIGRIVRAFVERRLPIMVNSDTVMDYVHVEDVADGIVSALSKGGIGESYLLTGEDVTWSEMVSLLEQFSGTPRPRLAVFPKIAKGFALLSEWGGRLTGRSPLITREAVSLIDNFTFLFDSSKARRELGWKARPFREGFRETVEWIRKNPA